MLDVPSLILVRGTLVAVQSSLLRNARRRGACAYTYRHASSTAPDGYYFTTTTTISWSVSWTSSTGAGGVLPPFPSETEQPLAVGDIQVLVTCTGPRPAQGGCA